jgi:hypothetical protein
MAAAGFRDITIQPGPGDGSLSISRGLRAGLCGRIAARKPRGQSGG